MNGDGDKQGVNRKKCPLLKEWCIGDACEFSVEIRQNTRGLQPVKARTCLFIASFMMISEINMKTQAPQVNRSNILRRG